jgi:hypothetical protein
MKSWVALNATLLHQIMRELKHSQGFFLGTGRNPLTRRQEIKVIDATPDAI